MADPNPFDDVIVTFRNVEVLSPPRGRCRIQLYFYSFEFGGLQIPYKNIHSVFLLPDHDDKFVVLALSKPIQEEGESYPYIVLQFQNDYRNDISLSISRAQLDNELKYSGLKQSYTEFNSTILAHILRRLSRARCIQEGNFRNSTNGSAVRCYMQISGAAEKNWGLMYPLGSGFLFLPNPPKFIPYNEVESVSILRIGVSAQLMYYFHVAVKLEDSKIFFRKIRTEEQHNLYSFLSQSGLNFDPDGGGSDGGDYDDDDDDDYEEEEVEEDDDG